MAVKKTIDFDQIIDAEHLATLISNQWMELNTYRQEWLEQTKELRNYLFATDTQTTSNQSLPWFHSTTTPKLTQIRDNLHANYFNALFPQRNWMRWEAEDKNDAIRTKRRVIEAYVENKTRQSNLVNTVSQLIEDWIDYGNCFAMVDHTVKFTNTEDGDTVTNYVGPELFRISPYDIVFDPTASKFENSPKIVKSLMSLGQIAKKAKGGDPDFSELLPKLREVRQNVGAHSDSQINKSEGFVADGFSNIQSYYQSNMVEFLTFYGDLYDEDSDELYENAIITIADRAFVVSVKTNPRWDGTDGIHHVGWRSRPDNLYAMGPLDNLVGMQYRIDHLENMKATVFDQIGLGMMKIHGEVEDFDIEPLARIYCGDEGDVNFLAPDASVLQADFQIKELENKMEEMAGMPKMAMGFRTPGEKTAFEVNQLMTSASRTFQHKAAHFERVFLEPILNDYLEVGRRRMQTFDVVRTLDDESGAFVFQEITKEDITGKGKIIPVGARHYAERAQRVQEIAQFAQLKQDPSVAPHISGVKMARIMAEELGEEELFGENVAILEQMQTQQFASSLQTQMEENEMIAAEEGL